MMNNDESQCVSSQDSNQQTRDVRVIAAYSLLTLKALCLTLLRCHSRMLFFGHIIMQMKAYISPHFPLTL